MIILFCLFQVFSFHLKKKRDKISSFIFSNAVFFMPFLLFWEQEELPSPCTALLPSVFIFCKSGVISVLQNSRDWSKRGFIFNTRPTWKQRSGHLKVMKEKLEKDCQESHWNFNYRIWILSGLFVYIWLQLATTCHAAICRHIRNWRIQLKVSTWPIEPSA